MKKVTTAVVGLFAVLGSGVALGVPPTTNALDQYAAHGALGGKGSRARPPLKIPTSPIEVDIALKDSDEERKKLEDELEAVDRDLPTAEARILARGRTYYKQIHAGLLPAGGGFDELVDYAARVERTRLSLTRDLDSAKKLRARRDDITEQLSRIAAERAPLEAQKRMFDTAKTYMRQANERKEAFDRAFASSTPPPDPVAIYGADQGPSDGGAAAGFSALRGKLPFPLAGRAKVQKLDASGGTGPALELRAGVGAAARAVAAGRVAYADRYQDDSLTVVIDHGDRYFTLYRNLETIEVKVGETVSSGASLGPVASQRRESVLYFELQKDGRPIEPGPWFGL